MAAAFGVKTMFVLKVKSIMSGPLRELVRVRAASVRRGVAHLLSTHHRPRRACLSGGVPPVAFDASSGSPRSGLPGGRVVGGFYVFQRHACSVPGEAGVFNHYKFRSL